MMIRFWKFVFCGNIWNIHYQKHLHEWKWTEMNSEQLTALLPDNRLFSSVSLIACICVEDSMMPAVNLSWNVWMVSQALFCCLGLRVFHYKIFPKRGSRSSNVSLADIFALPKRSESQCHSWPFLCCRKSSEAFQLNVSSVAFAKKNTNNFWVFRQSSSWTSGLKFEVQDVQTDWWSFESQHQYEKHLCNLVAKCCSTRSNNPVLDSFVVKCGQYTNYIKLYCLLQLQIISFGFWQHCFHLYWNSDGGGAGKSRTKIGLENPNRIERRRSRPRRTGSLGIKRFDGKNQLDSE